MKYQEVVVARPNSSQGMDLRQFYFPVELRDGKWVPCGPLIEETERVGHMSMVLSLGDYIEGEGDDCGPLTEITPPEGWTVQSRLWKRDDYVPESIEVREESELRIIEHMKKIGVWKKHD